MTDKNRVSLKLIFSITFSQFLHFFGANLLKIYILDNLINITLGYFICLLSLHFIKYEQNNAC